MAPGKLVLQMMMPQFNLITQTSVYGVLGGSWRGAYSPPVPYRGALEQGTEPPHNLL